MFAGGSFVKPEDLGHLRSLGEPEEIGADPVQTLGRQERSKLALREFNRRRIEVEEGHLDSFALQGSKRRQGILDLETKRGTHHGDVYLR